MAALVDLKRFGAPAQQPSVPAPTQANLVEVAQRLKELTEIWQGARGDGLDRVLTIRDLLNVGAIDPEQATGVFASGGLPAPPAIPHNPNDSVIPPTPENLSAMGAVGVIIVDWDFPDDYSRLTAFELWRSATDALGDAILIARPGAKVYSDEVGLAASYYYWVRAVSDGGVSPFNAVAGTLGDTPPAFEDLAAGTNNGEAFDAGIYLQEIRIKNGAMTTAKIGDLAVVDAKIANVSAAKITAGAVDVTQYIESTGYTPGSAGWRITGDGTAEFSGVLVRGQVIATSGTIGGLDVGSDHIQSTNYAADATGFRFNSDGTGQVGGFRIASGYIESTNYSAGATGWRLTNDGQILTPGFTLSAAGAATFSGALSGASGTFAGSLSAASGTFTGALSGASGTFSGTLTAQVVDTANIVGAAVTSTYTSNAASGTASSVSVTPPSGTAAIVILFYAGFFADSTSGTDQPWPIDLTVNGTLVKTAKSMGMHVISAPSGSYTISASSAGGQELVVMVAKR